MPAAYRESAPVMAPHRKLSVDDYHHLAQVGIFRPEEREVYLAPDTEQGRYREVRILTGGPLAPACFPDLALDVG